MQNLLLIFLIVFSIDAGAHTPQVSTISIIQNENKSWSVFITAPLYACQLSIKASHPNLHTAHLDLSTTQKMILSLLRNHLIFNDNKNIKPVDSKIKIGHETTLYFKIEDSLIIDKVDFKAFSELKDHFTLLKLVPYKEIEKIYVLNSDNAYIYNVHDKGKTVEYFSMGTYMHSILKIGITFMIVIGSFFLCFYVLMIRKKRIYKIKKKYRKK